MDHSEIPVPDRPDSSKGLPARSLDTPGFTPIPTHSKFLALEALRGIAALVVGIAHANMVLLAVGGLGNAGLAVDFFFMLSGFVLAHAYSERLNRGDYFRTFLLRRVVRLYPLIAIG